MARSLTIRESLIRSFAPLVLVVGLAAFALLVFAGQFAVRTLSAALIEQTHARITERLDAFFDPVLIEVRQLAEDAAAGDLHPGDRTGAAFRFFRVVSSVPHVASAIVTDETGAEIMLMQRPEGWLSRVTPADGPSEHIRWSRGGAVSPPEPGPEGYDPTSRPWFVGALAEPGEIHWTEPYAFFTSGDYGITVSVAVPAPGGRTVVVAIDVLLHELDEFTRSLTVQEGGQAYLLDRDGRVIGLPAAADFASESVRASLMLQPLESIGHTLSADAEDAYFRLVETHDLSEWPEPYRFTSGGEAWWSQVALVTVPGGLTLIPAVIVSERELLGPILAARWIVLAVAAGAVAFALWRCLAISRRLSSPIRTLADESDRIVRGDATIDTPPLSSRVLELDRLSASQVEMRLAMKTLGKLERDIQVAREIQQAQLPAELPSLPGWSFAGWSDPADATGGDIYDLVAHGGRVSMFLADATGHGVGPAISATQVRAMMRMAILAGASDAVTLAALNTQLLEDLPAGRFVTLWAGSLDPAAAALHVVSAGQAPMLRYVAADDRFEVRDAMVPPLGVVESLDLAADGELEDLAPGDYYAVFSDGIFEARSPAGELFGSDRVIAALRGAPAANAPELIDAVRRAVDDFCRGRPADDDRTGLIVRREASRD